MLRRVRHKLRMIRYYSATRQVSRWSRAFDAACIASLLLALPITWICNNVVKNEFTAASLGGHIHQLDDQSLVAVISVDGDRSIREFGKPEGNFKLSAIEQRRGWPFPTSIRRQPAMLGLDVLKETKSRGIAPFNASDPFHQAIDAELKRIGQDDLRNTWHRPSAESTQTWKGWLGSSVVWLCMLVGASSVLIGVSRYAAQVLGGKRSLRHAQLRAKGKCVTCGYDMTGLEFNERCPECGSLVY